MACKQIARILVSNVFSITNRGKVVGGEIIEGEVEAGNYFEQIKNGEILRYVISSVEIFHTKDNSKIGLLIKSDSADLMHLEDLNEQIIVINEA